MKKFAKILRLIKPYRMNAVLNILFNIVSIIFSAFSLVLIIPILRILFKMQAPVVIRPEFAWNTNALEGIFNYEMGQIVSQKGEIYALLLICLVIILVFFLKNLFRYAAMYVLAPLRNGVIKDIRSKIHQKIMKLPVGYFTEKRKGDIISRTTADVVEIEWSIMGFLEAAFKEPITIIVYLIGMLLCSYQLTLIVLIVLPIAGYFIGQIGKSLRNVSGKAQTKLGELISTLEESLSGLRIINAFNANDWQQEKFEKDNRLQAGYLTELLRKKDLASPLSEFMSIGVVALVLYLGGRMVLSENFNISGNVFILFIMLFAQVIPPARAFITANYNIQKGLASFERIEELLEAPDLIEDRSDAIAINSFNNKIEYKNVSFSYEAGENVLSEINFTLEKGKRVALVGSSGAGKSSLVDLLPRFYDRTSGSILLDGQDIKSVRLKDLRALMGIVTQESILFNDSVLNNIAIGDLNPDLKKAKEAARIANAEAFIENLENGYHGLIGERGDKLSGGEKQRLTIARAIYKNPPILILDEATSSLDSKSEKQVQEALEYLMENRTTIVIAHRLSTIQSADEILVMEKGKIIERGNHQQLLQNGGAYKKLVDLQAF